MAASSSTADPSWVYNKIYDIEKVYQKTEGHAVFYKVKEQGTNSIYVVKRFDEQAGLGADRRRRAIEAEGEILLAVREGVSTIIPDLMQGNLFDVMHDTLRFQTLLN
jgi:hypothetical protein